MILLKDYAQSVETDLRSNTKKTIELPESDVLQFVTEDGSIISARPSGTEPKIKFYCSVKGKLENHNNFADAESKLESKISDIMSDLNV